MRHIWIPLLMIAGALASQSQAGNYGRCCPSCGCGHAKKVCRLVQETRKTTTFEYDVECADFCLPGPSPVLCKKKVPDCDACRGYRIERVFGKPCWCDYPRTRKTLVKIPVTKEMKVWTCQVERVCCRCACAMLDEKATLEARAKEILPASAEQPVVLDDNSDFDVEPARGALDLDQPASVTGQDTPATAPTVETTSASGKSGWLSKLFGG